MKKISILLFPLFMVLAAAAQTKPPAPAASGHAISITLTPYKNCEIYLGSYFGKGKILSDSAHLNEKSQGVFRGKTKLPGGIYFVVSPQLTIQFDVLIGKDQQFSIVGDSSHKESAAITGSPDNDLFRQYSAGSAQRGKHLQDLMTQLPAAKDAADSARVRASIKEASKDLDTYRAGIIRSHPGTLLAALLNAMKHPETPAIPVVNGKPDSTYPFRYVKEHYWDDVAFNDDRLLHTPFFEAKLDEYFKYYVSPDADSIIPEMKYILLSARTGKEMYPYLLTKFTNKYMNPEYMGQDKAFLYLFENFYTKGDTTFLNAASRKTIFDRAYSMMANQIGNPAPALDLSDTSGKTVSLYSLNAPYTLVVFWDPTCGHCKEEIPRVDSIYRAKWKAMGMKLYSVNVKDGTGDELKKFAKEKNLSPDWIYTSQPKAAFDAEQAAGKANFRQLYDVFKTPTLYLLDDKKHIIAKQLTELQFDDVMTARSKKQPAK